MKYYSILYTLQSDYQNRPDQEIHVQADTAEDAMFIFLNNVRAEGATLQTPPKIRALGKREKFLKGSPWLVIR